MYCLVLEKSIIAKVCKNWLIPRILRTSPKVSRIKNLCFLSTEMAEFTYINGTNPWTPPWENQNFSPFTPNYYSYYLYLSKLCQFNQDQNHENEQASQNCPLMISQFSARGQEFYSSISSRQYPKVPVFPEGSPQVSQEAPWRNIWCHKYKFMGWKIINCIDLTKILKVYSK